MMQPTPRYERKATQLRLLTVILGHRGLTDLVLELCSGLIIGLGTNDRTIIAWAAFILPSSLRFGHPHNSERGGRYRRQPELEFRQDEIVVRASAVTLLRER